MTDPGPVGALATQRRRVGWGLADQALSSLTNFAVGITVARTLGPAGFGAFSIAFAVYLALLGISRAMASEPLTVRYSAVPHDHWRSATARASGTALLIGLVAGLVVVGVQAFTSGGPASALLGLAVCLPGLLLQDAWRFAFLARGAGQAAFLNDAVWLVTLFTLLGGVIATQPGSVMGFVLAWGGAASVAAAVGALQARLIPRPLQTRDWWREHRDIAGRFAAESASLTGAQQASVFGIAAVGGLTVVGALRAGQILLGPVQTVYLGVHLVAVPEAVRLMRAGRDLLRPVVALSVAMAMLAMAFGGALLAVPESLGEAVLQDSWQPARSILAPLTLAVAAAGAHIGPLVALRAMAAARHSLRSRLAMSGVVVCAEVAGAAVGGASGAAWGSAGAMWIGVAVWWQQLAAVRAARRRHTAQE